MLLVQSSSSHGDHRLTLEEVRIALENDGLVSDAQSERLNAIVTRRESPDKHPLEIVADQGWHLGGPLGELLDLERLTRWLAERTNMPYARIDPLKIDVETVTGLVKHAYATRFRILPIEVTDDQVTVATAEPYEREWESELNEMLGRTCTRVLVNPRALRRFLVEFYAVSRSLSGAASSRSARVAPVAAGFEQLVELEKVGEPDANDQHVVRIVDWLLQYAFEQRASDIHLEPRRESANVRFRIDGQLHLVHQLTTPVLGAMVSRLKAIGRMNVVERRRPQDGRIKTRSPGGREVEMRLSTMPTTFGEKLVARIFDPDALIKSFSELGFSAHDRRRWESMVSQSHGMVIVTGPTGSGKTTTLYSVLKHLARPEINICTIEDPIELVDPMLNQMNVQSHIGLDFATGVRTLLRQDPDVIMVGEIRDAETAHAAMQAALTGHLVLTTLHTNDAASSITRLLDLGVPSYLIRSAVLGVAAQRLVRTLCPHCRAPREMPAAEWAALIEPFKMMPPTESFAARGCDECRHTGYLGRVGLYEILTMSDALRELITPTAEVSGLRRKAVIEGMRPLRVSGAEKVRAGLTTATEIFAVLND